MAQPSSLSVPGENGPNEGLEPVPDSQRVAFAKASTDEVLRNFKLLHVLRSGDTSDLNSILSTFPTYTPPAQTNHIATEPLPRKSMTLPSSRFPPSRQSTSSSTHHGPSILQDMSATSAGLASGIVSPAAVLSSEDGGQQGTQVIKGLLTPLHMAVRCAKVAMVRQVLLLRPSDLNVQDPRTGHTALHIAATRGSAEIVALLLAQPDVDDSLVDREGKTCLEAADGPNTAKLIQVSRAQYNDTFLQALEAYIALPPSTPQRVLEDSLIHRLVERPRGRILEFTARDRATGTTVLHEAARRQDVQLLKLSISRGADVLVRDRKGKLPMDVLSKGDKHDKIRALLKQTATSEGRALRAQEMSQTGSNGVNLPSAQPTCKGYLKKWANYGQGYQNRYFVLDNGILSYYRHQDDEGHSSRGSISMSIAKLTLHPEDPLKFDVSSKISKHGKLFFRADHPVEAMRWINAFKIAIQLAQPGQNLSLSNSPEGTPYAPSIAPSANDDKSSIRRLVRKLTTRGSPSNGSVTDVDFVGSGVQDREDAAVDTSSTIADDEIFGTDPLGPPDENSIVLLANAVKTQLELTEQLVDALVVPVPAVGAPANLMETDRPASVRSGTSQRQADVKGALRESLRELLAMFKDYVSEASRREKHFVRNYEREIEAKALWEENMKEVAAQQAELENELHKVTREASRRKKALRQVRNSIAGTGMLEDESVENMMASSSLSSPAGSPVPSSSVLANRMRSASLSGQVPVSDAIAEQLESVDEQDQDSEDDDEFFEAIESGAISVSAEVPLIEPTSIPGPEEPRDDMVPYEPYKSFRDRLPIANDDRPPASLWTILKSNIGKDLTKISLPVGFNESTSMLQRMAEDMEFSECLDVAAQQQDPAKRIAYVAAFAMSNYSSTYGRIAKPFNPMLGETFEYARPDKWYRYMSEQVSHHPPISACIAESPKWHYFGEVDAKSKFTGKSFEIRPTGIAHTTLYLPESDEWGTTGYPKEQGRETQVAEHYSWKKVISSVNNLILGTPQIDHYGDMEVTNHRNGYKCVLTFKPRGWRAKDSYEIKGVVTDPSGSPCWEIAGRWTSQLIARKVGAESGTLDADQDLSSPSKAEYILLWKNSFKPPGMPFNLTPFAITLNDTPDSLKPWLPPTDCRLRPDQHAFEKGLWDRAGELKQALEDHQRAKRKARERGELAEHIPRWFTRRKDPDSGEGYWEPAKLQDGKLEYWVERERVGKLKLQSKEDAEWNKVEEIFGEYASTVG